jgi:hypothetical protein
VDEIAQLLDRGAVPPDQLSIVLESLQTRLTRLQMQV